MHQIKNLPVTAKRPIMGKHTILKRKNGIVLRENSLEKMFIQVYYVRCNCNSLMGFFMNKAQSRRIIKDLHQYLRYKLKFDVSKNLLRYIFSDKIQFLGFEIQRTPLGTFKHLKNKKWEVYRRHQNTNFKEEARDHVRFLKAVE